MKCTNPLCIHYYEVTNLYNSKKIIKPICLKYDIDINYYNLVQIQNCQDHKTFRQLKENWKNMSC